MKQPKYKDIGEDPDGVLGMCSGDCDTDKDCDSGLKCMQREGQGQISYVFGETPEGNVLCDLCDHQANIFLSINPNYQHNCLPYPSFPPIMCWLQIFEVLEGESGPNSCSGKVSGSLRFAKIQLYLVIYSKTLCRSTKETTIVTTRSTLTQTFALMV